MRRYLIAVLAAAGLSAFAPGGALASHGSAHCAGDSFTPAVAPLTPPLIGPVLLFQAVHEVRHLAVRHCG